MKSPKEDIPKPPDFDKAILELPKLENIEDLKSHCLDRVNIEDEIWKPINIPGFRHMQISTYGRVYSEKDDRLFSPYVHQDPKIKGFDKVFYRMLYIPAYSDNLEESSISVPIADLLRITFGKNDKEINIRVFPKDKNIFNVTFENIDSYDKRREYKKYSIKPIYINGIKTKYSISSFGHIYIDGKMYQKGYIYLEDKIILRNKSGKDIYTKRFELLGRAFLPNPKKNSVVKIINRKVNKKSHPPHFSMLEYRNISSKQKKYNSLIFFY